LAVKEGGREREREREVAFAERKVKNGWRW